MKIAQITGAKGFDYDDSPQRSPRWQKLHVGRVGASDLGRWLAVSKRDSKPLKGRSDLEREIAFEITFNVPFSKFVTGAMQEGIDNEDYVRDQYSAKMGVEVKKAGAFYSKHFIASPDGLVGEDGGIEIKWLQDSNWTEVIASGKPLDDHYKQTQGNLYASGRKWWDYIAANGNTGRYFVLRVERDEEMIKGIADSVKEVSTINKLSPGNVFEFSTDMPVGFKDEDVAFV